MKKPNNERGEEGKQGELCEAWSFEEKEGLVKLPAQD